MTRETPVLESPGELIDMSVVAHWPRTSESEAGYQLEFLPGPFLLSSANCVRWLLRAVLCCAVSISPPPPLPPPPPRKTRAFGSGGGDGNGNGSISMESLLELYPGFMELGDTGKVAFLSLELLNSSSLSCGVCNWLIPAA